MGLPAPINPLPSSPLDWEDIVAPLNRLGSAGKSLIIKPLGPIELAGEATFLPRYVFQGADRGEEPIRLGLFAAIHGDEPAGTLALVELLRLIEAQPELAAGYCLFVYPVCNPTGFAASTRENHAGYDLNREFWQASPPPEVALLQSELTLHAFHGLISLHSDADSPGIYGYARGATMTRFLLEPALAAAECVLPRNRDSQIDGFGARQGIIKSCYKGVLSSPQRLKPRPFEIVFETPLREPLHLQTQATVLAVLAILAEYRKFIAYAANL